MSHAFTAGAGPGDAYPPDYMVGFTPAPPPSMARRGAVIVLRTGASLCVGLGRWARRARWRRILATTATFAAMGGVVWLLLSPPEFLLRPAHKPAPPAPAWVDVVKPIQLYRFSGAAIAGLPRATDVYQARRHEPGGGRIDTLTVGRFESREKPWLMVEIHRFGQEDTAATSFFVDMARRAARSGMSVQRSAVSGLIQTRFGSFETADLGLSGGATSATCLGFRFRADAPGLSIAGFACGGEDRPVDRAWLGCALDRLDLVASGEDVALGRFFAAAERARGGDCSRAPRADAGRWLDPTGRPPALKGLRASRG